MPINIRADIRAKTLISTVLSHPSAIEPLLPTCDLPILEEITCDVLRETGGLQQALPSKIARLKVQRLIREMNSYYSNLIEGHKTLPRDIERALKKDFFGIPEKKDNQLLSVAHIETEALMAQRVLEGDEPLYAAEFVCWLHGEFYRRLPERLHWAKTQSGREYRVHPGKLRDFNVDVGRHTPPDHVALERFLGRFAAFYGGPEILPTKRIVAIAAAHHRLAWIHPFGDGNGRVIRLHSHALLMRAKVDGFGLWTLSRGLAREKKRYYEHLQAADQKRGGDYDGRGNLSDRSLFQFCEFFLGIMLDQIRFVSSLLELAELNRRIDLYFQRDVAHVPRFREELARLVKALLIEDIRIAVKEGLVATPSERGKLSIAFPAKVVESYFPKLFIDLPVD